MKVTDNIDSDPYRPFIFGYGGIRSETIRRICRPTLLIKFVDSKLYESVVEMYTRRKSNYTGYKFFGSPFLSHR